MDPNFNSYPFATPFSQYPLPPPFYQPYPGNFENQPVPHHQFPPPLQQQPPPPLLQHNVAPPLPLIPDILQVGLNDSTKIQKSRKRKRKNQKTDLITGVNQLGGRYERL